MKKTRIILSLILALSLLFAMGAMGVSATEDTDTPAEVDLDGVYHATLGIQTNPTLWQSRMGYYVADHNDTYGTEYWDKLCSGTFGTDSFTTYAGTFNDAEIAGNGTYTVSLVNADFGGETSVSQLHAATDIPDTGAITFTDFVVKVNGRKVAEYEEAYIDKDGYADDLCVLLAYNNWRSDLKGMDGVMDPEILPNSAENEISITFTVSGFNYDNVEQAEAAANDAANDAANADTNTDSNSEGGCTGSAAMLPIAAVVIAAALVVFKKRG